MPIIVVGLLAFLGGIGLTGIFIGRQCYATAVGIGNIPIGLKSKIISPIFNIGNIIVLVAFLVLFILCIVLDTHIIGWSHDLCPHHIDEAGVDMNTCQEIIDRANANICPGEERTLK